MKPNLIILDGMFSIHRFNPDRAVPDPVFQASFFSITKTADELSVVCPSGIKFFFGREESGWSCIKVAGPLDFSLTGILSDISKVLADAGISIFAISTFDTDYILVKANDIKTAQNALEQAAYHFFECDPGP